MTLWAFLSDIHGNRSALERALDICRQRGVERYAVLGDLLGRGDPDAVVSIVRSLADLAVVGNRDLDWAERVSERTRAYVLGLPRVAEADRFVAVHGDARLDRVLNADDVRHGGQKGYAELRRRGRQVLLFGHTHRARVWHKTGPDAPQEELPGVRLELDLTSAESVYFVNVGTTGRPFPGKGPASFTLFGDEPGEAWVETVVLNR